MCELAEGGLERTIVSLLVGDGVLRDDLGKLHVTECPPLAIERVDKRCLQLLVLLQTTLSFRVVRIRPQCQACRQRRGVDGGQQFVGDGHHFRQPILTVLVVDQLQPRCQDLPGRVGMVAEDVPLHLLEQLAIFRPVELGQLIDPELKAAFRQSLGQCWHWGFRCPHVLVGWREAGGTRYVSGTPSGRESAPQWPLGLFTQ